MKKIPDILRKIFLSILIAILVPSYMNAKIGDGIRNSLGLNNDEGPSQNMKDNVQSAESAAAIALREEIAAKEKLATLETKLKNAKGDTTELEKQIKEARLDVVEKQDTRIKAANALIDTYRALGDSYEKAGLVGDPVQIGTGNYIYSKDDFIAEDFLDKFQIKRSFRNNSARESFGKLWTCSLDSRILRGKHTDPSKSIKIINNEIDLLSTYKETADQFFKKQNHYPEGSEETLAEIHERLNELSEIKKIYEKYQEENSEVDKINKFVAYGNYANNQNLEVGIESLVFIDEDSFPVVCVPSSDGEGWVPFNEIKAQEFYISSGNENDYIINYRNGEKRYFDKSGLLYKIEDRNGNVQLFYTKNGFITKIKNKTGEIIDIERNSKNQIVKISGPVSGTSQFMYTNETLVYACNNSKKAETYSYNLQGNLTTIKKGSDSTIKIYYDSYADKTSKVSKVTDEAGNTEYFNYLLPEKKVIHKTTSGETEIYELNDNNSTVHYENEFGVSRSFLFNEKNQISGIKENDEWKYFTYDDYLQPVEIRFEDGVCTKTEYNNFGQITFQSDKDGFTNEFIYDEKGNLIETKYCDVSISKLEYYPNGLIKSVEENGGRYIYEYNSFGAATRKTEIDINGNQFTENFEYDSNNRLTKYINHNNQVLNILYDENSKTEISDDKKTVHRFNYKNQEIETIETDLKTGKHYSKETIYDGGGKPVEVLLDGKKYLSYEYDKPQLMTACTIWDLKDETQGLRMEYAFDNKNRLISESCCYVMNGVKKDEKQLYKVSYEDLSNGFVMNVKKGTLDDTKYFYNNKNQLVKIMRPDGAVEERFYTKGGKISSVVEKGKRSDFYYSNNGNSTVEIRNKNQLETTITYNGNGNLIYREDFDGSIFTAIYDDKGRCIRENGPSYFALYDYDYEDRKIDEKVYNLPSDLCYECTYKYDDLNRCVEKIEGNKYVSKNYFDCWGNLIKIQDSNGETTYDYDILGNCISQTTDDGIVTEFNYDCTGNLIERFVNQISVEKNVWASDGKILENYEFGIPVLKCTYDKSGNCTSITDDFGNVKSFEFNYDGSINSVKGYESNKNFLTYEKDSNSLFVSTGNESIYKEVFDDSMNLIRETNSMGYSANYFYDSGNRLISVNDFDGNNYSYSYDNFSNSTKQIFNSKDTYVIKKNALGMITSLKSPDEDFYYIYDTGKKLVEEGEIKTGVKVFYDYDTVGRCIRKYGSFFDIEYVYDSTGKISSVKENKDNSNILIFYDVFGREEKRELSNGIQIFSKYDSYGKKIASYAKEPYGLVVSGDFTLYDNNGRKFLNSGKDGQITKYTYDSEGRLISTEYPYNNEILNNAKKEAVECGIFIKEDRPKGSVLKISYDEFNVLSGLLKESGLPGKIDRNQYCWKEQYSYTPSGSIKSVENPFGKIIYEYDSENRLIQKHGEHTMSGGTFYSWSKNGNLEEVLNNYQHMVLKYEAFNRPSSIVVEDYETGDVDSAFYTYDALGRRISESTSSGERHYFIYDGFSNDILIDSPVFQNQSAVVNYEVQNNVPSVEQDFRTVNPMEYEKFNGFRTRTSAEKILNEIESTELKFESRPCISIVANGIPSAYLYLDNKSLSGKETEFIMMNSSLTSVTAVIDKHGNCIGINDYDTWGNPCSEKEVSSKYLSLSNSKNTLRISNCIYDLGQRDYMPSMKSFISKDPKKDGFNWYAYCSCDPVNYSDFTGFEKSCLSPYQLARYNEGVAEHLLFDEQAYHGAGSSAGIHHTYDCADVSGAVDANAATYAGISGYSTMADAFREAHNNEQYSKARQKINSWSFFTGNTDANVKQTSTGFNRNEYRKGKGQVQERANAYKSLQNPDILSPGTVLVWKNPDHVDGENWIGHTMTVLCRDFDSDGNVIGFAYIEGHTSGDRTELGYMGTNTTYIAGINTIDYWIGDYLGTFEIERRNAVICD